MANRKPLVLNQGKLEQLSDSDSLVVGLGLSPDGVVPRTYVESRMQNLVANGNGHMRTNYNFSAFTLSQEDTHNGRPASFKTSGNNVVRVCDEYIPIDPTKTYRIAIWAKAGNVDNSRYNANNRQCFGHIEFDSDYNQIEAWMYSKSLNATDTTLAAPLNPGDTTVTLSNATGWFVMSQGAYRHFAWYPWTNARGYSYPDYTYTRNGTPNYYSVDGGAWAAGGISGNVITLRSPWQGPALPAGTKVRNCAAALSVKYSLLNTGAVPNTWTEYSGVIGAFDGNSEASYLGPFVAYIRLAFLVNVHGVDDTDLRISEVFLGETNYGQGDLRPDGSAAAPSYAFVNAPDTGMYRAGGVIGFAHAGNHVLTIGTNLISNVPLVLPDGSAAAPSHAFVNSPNTGMYRYGGTVGFSYAGNRVLSIGSSLQSEVPVRIPDGTAAAPSLAYADDPDTGIYRSADNTIMVVTGGVNIMAFGSAFVVCYKQLTVTAGSATTPTYSFGAQSNTGIYYTNNTLNFAVQGTQRAYMGTAGMVVNGYVQSAYRSSDGTAGVTANVAVAKVGGGTRTLRFKDGLYTGYTDS